MRIVTDIVDNVFSSVRLMILLFFGAIILFGLFMTVGTAVVAPQIVDKAAERAERVGGKAIVAAQEERRNYALAQEGWGYSQPSEGTGSTVEDGEVVGGWGD